MATLSPPLSPPTGVNVSDVQVEEKLGVKWTAGAVFASLGIFVLAGLAEIGGGWLVWQGIRAQPRKPWYWVLGGSLVLVAYGFIPTLQPQGVTFARSYAVYGGVFIVMSYLWGWAVDKERPDNGDWVGGAIALAGVGVAWFWPRGGRAG